MKSGYDGRLQRYAGAVVGRAEDLVVQAQGRGLRWLTRAGSRLRPGRQPTAHLAAGTAGEREALLSLRRHGYIVVARRWTTGKLRGDLDMVAWHGDTLCFVEVKTRTERDALSPAESAVDREKRRILRQMAWAYLRSFPPDRRHTIPVRFDIVAVYLIPGEPLVEIFPAAFAWRDPRRSPRSGFGV